MATTLPANVLEFLERTASTFPGDYVPAWLKSNFDDPTWVINTQKGDLRTVKGKVKGGLVLRWNVRFGDALFTSREYAAPLRQCKRMLIVALDSTAESRVSVLSLDAIHRCLMWFAEYLAVRRNAEFKKHGLLISSLDDVSDLLDVAQMAGVAGIGMYAERWERYLREKCQEHHCIDLHQVLQSIGAYDAHGRLKTDFVGNAIGVDTFRVRKSNWMRAYLVRYDLRVESGVLPIPQPMVGIKYIARGILLISAAMQSGVDGMAESELANVDGVSRVCQQYLRNTGRRTRSLPPSVGRKLVSDCCHWLLNTWPALEIYARELCRKVGKCASNEGSIAGPMRRLRNAEKELLPPPALREVLATLRQTLRRQQHQTVDLQTSTPIVIDAIWMHVMICFTLVALFSCSRRDEILELERSPISTKGRRHYLQVALRKTGMDGLRLSTHKPIPDVTRACLQSLRRIETIISGLLDQPDPLMATRAFFKATRRGIVPLARADVAKGLRELGEFLGLVDQGGQQWILSPHQLRRHFAMTFFHAGGTEDALPALTWFMGHDDIMATWRYVKEEMTGREISEAEAAMATSAIYSSDDSEPVRQLRNIVSEHFGCDHIAVMDECEVQEYLEMLVENGIFTARPVQISAGSRMAFTVLISIKEGACRV